MKRDLLKAESIIPPDFPGVSGTVNAGVVLLQEESLKVSDYCELGIQQCRNLSSLPPLSKRSGLNRPRAQIFSLQKPGLTAARLCLYRMVLCNPTLPAPPQKIVPVIKQLSIEAVLSFVPMAMAHFSYFTVLLLHFLLIINFNGLVTSFRKIQSVLVKLLTLKEFSSLMWNLCKTETSCVWIRETHLSLPSFAVQNWIISYLMCSENSQLEHTEAQPKHAIKRTVGLLYAKMKQYFGCSNLTLEHLVIIARSGLLYPKVVHFQGI